MSPARLPETLFYSLSGLDGPAFSVGEGSGMQEEGMEDVRLLIPCACVLGCIPGFFKLRAHSHIPPALLCISVPGMDEETEDRACEAEELKPLREDIRFHSAHRKMKWWKMKELNLRAECVLLFVVARRCPDASDPSALLRRRPIDS